MLERERAFYEANKAEFRDKYLVITGESLYGAYDKLSEAAIVIHENFKEEDSVIIHRPADDGKVIEIEPFVTVERLDGIQEEEPNFTMQVAEGEPVKFQYAS